MTWFKNLNALPKLMLSFGLVLAFTAGLGFTAYRMAKERASEIDPLSKRNIACLLAIQDFENTKTKIDALSQSVALSAPKASQKQELGHQEKQFAALIVLLQSRLQDAERSADRTSLKVVLERLGAGLPEYEHANRSLFQRAQAEDWNGAASALKDLAPLESKLDALSMEASRAKLASLEEFSSGVNDRSKRVELTILGLLSVAILFGLGLSVSIAGSFSHPLSEAVLMLQKLSQGDLTQRLRVASTNEVGRLAEGLNHAIENIDAALSEVGASSKNLSSASRQLAKAAEGLAAGAQEQAASLEETSASLEEITATVRQNSDNAKHASQLAFSSRDSAEKGGQSASETAGAMAEIKTSSSKISEIIATIDEIAFQTNLLSVNASVEAARAGVHGNGFKVVATEVRNLAQRSAAAAKEIKTLINGSVKKVENGSKLVLSSGTTLKEIVSSVKRVSDIVGEIAAASQEQATGIEQVGKAMMQMDRVTQSNSSQTEELSATAVSLAAQSNHLDSLVSRFVLSSSPSTAKTKEVSSASQPLSVPAQNVSFSEPRAASLLSSKDDLSRNLESMASNIGRSVSIKTRDEEFDEF